METSQSVCSAAVFSGENLLGEALHDVPNEHNKIITVVMERAMHEAGIVSSQLTGVAVSEGPGSYTGLRVGASASKAFCYALKIPLIPVNTLQLIAYQAAQEAPGASLYVPMVDARRMEVFMASYDAHLNLCMPPKAYVVKDDFRDAFDSPHVVFAGNGSAKLRLLDNVPQNDTILSEVIPMARFMGYLANQRSNRNELPDPAYFEPQYVKAFGEKAINDI